MVTCVVQRSPVELFKQATEGDEDMNASCYVTGPYTLVEHKYELCACYRGVCANCDRSYSTVHDCACGEKKS